MDDFGINDFLVLLRIDCQVIRHQIVNETGITLCEAVRSCKRGRFDNRGGGTCQLKLVQDVL